MNAETQDMDHGAVTVFVCVTCRGTDGDPDHRPGRRLFDALRARLGDTRVAPVECLSVCKRPCTVALSAGGKWTYVVGDLGERDQVEDVVEMAQRYGATADGIVPWRERPVSFRRGVVARVPPLGS